MKTIAQAIAMVILVTASGCGYFVSASSAPLTPPAAAPAFQLADADATLRLDDLLAAGAPVVLEFHRGEFCMLARGRMKELQAEKARFDAAGATIVAISADDVATATAERKKLGLTFHLAADPKLEAIDAYRVHMDGDYRGRELAVPSTFVIAPDGRIVFHHRGTSAGDFAEIDDVLQAVLEARRAKPTIVSTARQ